MKYKTEIDKAQLAADTESRRAQLDADVKERAAQRKITLSRDNDGGLTMERS